jgi:hypothetical protein
MSAPMNPAPMNPDVVPRSDWRDSLALAADLALLGIMTMTACVPVVTAGAALATASAATDHACVHGGLPPMADLWRTFRRALLPGLGATAAVAAAGLLLTFDIRLLATGLVPGGAALLVVTVALAAAGLALGVLALVRVGATGGRGWLAAARWAAGRLAARPWLGVVLLAVLVLPAMLGVMIPATALLLPGFVLFALHVVARRQFRR